MPKFSNSQDLVAIKEIKEDTVILKNGSLRQILMVSGMNFSLKSSDEQNQITLAYQNFLNSLDFSVQIIVHSRKINIQKYIDDLQGLLEREASPLLKSQIEEYRDFVSKFVQENAIMEKTFLVVVPWHSVSLPTKSSAFDSLPFFGKKKDATQKAAEDDRDFKQNLLQLKQRTMQVSDGLGAIGLEAIVLKDEELTELFYNFYNPETMERESIKRES